VQITYASHLRLPTKDRNDPLQDAIGAVAKWSKRRFGVTPQPLSAGRFSNKNVLVEWSTLLGSDAGLFGLWVDQADRADRTWRWRTYIDVGVEQGLAWVRIRVHLYSTVEGLVTRPDVVAGRPGVVRDLVRELELQADGLEMGRALAITASDVGDLTKLIKAPGRRLPVVVLSVDSAGLPFIDAAHLTDRLLGLAHVSQIDSEAASVIASELGQPLSVYGGAIRVYWPRLTGRDDPHRHRLYAGGALAYLGVEGVESDLFETLGRLAGLSMDEPPLRRRLVAEKRAVELSRSVEARAATLTRLDRKPEEKDSVPAAEYAELFAEYERLDEMVTSLEEDALAHADEMEILELQRDEARDELKDVLDEWRQSQPASDEITPAQTHSPIESVVEAVRRAQEDSSSCIYLPEALESAKESGYKNAENVYSDLMLIEDLAREWAQDALPNGPHAAFKERFSTYRDGIGQTATTRYRTDYERSLDGKPIMLGPHIRKGVGAVTNILRIYMYFDSANQRIVIGHVGRKLRDSSNRN
jgi:uncharacterized protein YdcH (DUF465 family)